MDFTLDPSSSVCPASSAHAALIGAVQFFLATQCAMRTSYPPDAHPTNGSWFDFIVVGGGTAGATVAARLAGRGAVLLVEAGPDPPQEAMIPGFMNSFKTGRYDWQFTTENDHVNSQAFIGGAPRQPRGKLLGGCGSTNDMVYSRGSPKDYDGWAKMLNDNNWDWSHVLPYFKKTENITVEAIVQDPILMKNHSTSGEMQVSSQNVSSLETKMFLEAFQQIGFGGEQDMTSYKHKAAGRFSHTIRNGERESTVTALLNPAAKRFTNLKVLKNALVTKVLIKDDTAYGVEVLIDGYLFNFNAKKEVILSAGAFNTPKILMLSGIGPKEHLQEMSIKVVNDLPIGDNLQDHVMTLTYIAADEGTCTNDNGTMAMDMVRYFYDRSGPYASNDRMAAYLSINPNTPKEANFAYYPSCLPVNVGFAVPCQDVMALKPDICSKIVELNKNKEILTVAVVLLNPKSRGKVRLRSADPMDQPIIQAGTFSNPDDLDSYPEAMKVVEKLMETPYFKSKNAEIIKFDIKSCKKDEQKIKKKEVIGKAISSEKQVERQVNGVGESKNSKIEETESSIEGQKCIIRAMSMGAWHSSGSAAMGAGVDGRLRVRGVGGLRVVDASAMPALVRGNTNAPVVMMAEQAADFIIADHNLISKASSTCDSTPATNICDTSTFSPLHTLPPDARTHALRFLPLDVSLEVLR